MEKEGIVMNEEMKKLTEEEKKELKEKLKEQIDEMTEEELEKVAGGTMWSRIIDESWKKDDKNNN